MLDVIVREWLLQSLREAEPEMPEYKALSCIFLALFYADDGYIASTDPELLQESMDVLIALFERVGLRTNVSKTKVETCIDGKIRTRLSEPAYTCMRSGLGTRKEWGARKVECNLCNKQFAVSSLSNHLETQHGVFRSRVINQDLLVEHKSQTFTAHRNVSGTYACPVPGCVGIAHTNCTLRGTSMVVTLGTA
jgi:hypothetical protein